MLLRVREWCDGLIVAVCSRKAFIAPEKIRQGTMQVVLHESLV